MPKTKKKQSIKDKANQLVAQAKQRLKVYLERRPHHSFKLTKRPRLQLGGTPLPSIPALLNNTLSFLRDNKNLFFGIALMYALLSYFLVGGVSQIDFVAMREVTIETMSGELGSFGTMLSLFGGTLTGAVAEPPTQVQQLLGTILSFVFWLAFVWAARMVVAGEKVGVRDTLYSCCAPLISSMLVMFFILVQALPGILALFGFALLQATGIIGGGVELAIAVIAVGLVWLLCTYWIVGSSMALVVVTLPQMYPWQALSAASELVVGQRWRIALHIGVTLLAAIVVWAVVMFFFLMVDSWLKFDWLPLIPVVVQTLSAATLMFFSVYIYKLYRSLL